MALVIAALAGELVCRVRLARQMAAAATYELRHPHAYGGQGVVEGASESLWERQWDEYKKSSRTVLTVGGEEYSVETNALGYRTHEFAARKPAGMLRVLCIGGSTTVQGRTNDATYPAILERRLRERHPSESIEVLNLGVSGTQSGYWAGKNYRLLEFEPDVVVQYEGVNDLVRAVPRWARQHPWASAPYRSVLFARVFPFPHRGLDDEIAPTLENIAALSRRLRSVRALHVVGTFAAPDASRAPAEFRGYLAYNLLTQWRTGTLPLYSYAAYEDVVGRFNALLSANADGRYRVAPVAAGLTSPDRFVDVCHHTPQGIAELADAFLPEVERAVSDQLQRRARVVP